MAFAALYYSCGMDLGTGSIHTQTTSYDLARRRSFGNTYTEAPLAACIGVTMDIAHLQSIPHTFNGSTG